MSEANTKEQPKNTSESETQAAKGSGYYLIRTRSQGRETKTVMGPFATDKEAREKMPVGAMPGDHFLLIVAEAIEEKTLTVAWS